MVESNDVTAAERQRVKELHDRLGTPKTAKRLGLSPDTVLRILAEVPVHRGTVLLLREALATLEDGQ